ncbi:MAG: 30S ribosomal protein S16 [Chitinophagales bacterium]|nr:30S ribosomal protein S16 [Chitinophagales bacterium]
MAVKIRLQRMGRKKSPFYHIIIADSRSPRDGRFIESIGSYDPTTIPATINLNKEKALDWLQKGAQPTDTLHKILSFKGVLYRKHLLRGVKKGIFDQDMADQKMVQWEDSHSNAIMDAKEKGRSGVKKKKTKKGAATTPAPSA